MSITATIAATMILAFAQEEFSASPRSLPRPEMTSGGKFAARIDTGQPGGQSQAIAVVNALVPIPIADDAPPVRAAPVDTGPIGSPGTDALIRLPRRVTRVEPRHRVAHAFTQPRHVESAGVTDQAAHEPEASTFMAADSDVAATVKGVGRRVVLLGVTMLDPRTWSNLLP